MIIGKHGKGQKSGSFLPFCHKYLSALLNVSNNVAIRCNNMSINRNGINFPKMGWEFIIKKV